MDDKILTITKVNFTGKWVEFWFDGGKPMIKDDSECYHESSKAYMLWDAAEKAGLTNEIHNTGFVGKKLKWTYDAPNWEIVEFILNT